MPVAWGRVAAKGWDGARRVTKAKRLRTDEEWQNQSGYKQGATKEKRLQNTEDNTAQPVTKEGLQHKAVKKGPKL